MLYNSKTLCGVLYEDIKNVPYITKKEFEDYKKNLRKENKFETILYNTKLEEYKPRKRETEADIAEYARETGLDLIQVDDKYFILTDESSKKATGYFAISETQFVRIEKKFPILPILFFCMISLVLVWFIYLIIADMKIPPKTENPLTQVPGNVILEDSSEDWLGGTPNTTEDKEQENIIIPGFHKFIASEKVKDLILYNPPENTVYFKYSILKVLNTKEVTAFNTIEEAQIYTNKHNVLYNIEKDESGKLYFSLDNGDSSTTIDIYKIVEKKDNTYSIIKETVVAIFATNAIPPGKQVTWDTYTNLGVGEYELKFKIDTYDIETGKQCYGAIQEVNGIVQ